MIVTDNWIHSLLSNFLIKFIHWTLSKFPIELKRELVDDVIIFPDSRFRNNQKEKKENELVFFRKLTLLTQFRPGFFYRLKVQEVLRDPPYYLRNY